MLTPTLLQQGHFDGLMRRQQHRPHWTSQSTLSRQLCGFLHNVGLYSQGVHHQRQLHQRSTHRQWTQMVVRLQAAHGSPLRSQAVFGDQVHSHVLQCRADQTMFASKANDSSHNCDDWLVQSQPPPRRLQMQYWHLFFPVSWAMFLSLKASRLAGRCDRRCYRCHFCKAPPWRLPSAAMPFAGSSGNGKSSSEEKRLLDAWQFKSRGSTRQQYIITCSGQTQPTICCGLLKNQAGVLVRALVQCRGWGGQNLVSLSICMIEEAMWMPSHSVSSLKQDNTRLC